MEMPGLLAAAVVHHLNNTPHVIRNTLTTLQRHVRGVNAEVLGCLERIRGNFGCASMRARRLLAAAPQPLPDRKPVDLNELISGMHDSLTELLGKGIVLVVELDPTLCPARTDRKALEVALIDLAVSARVAMNGCGRLTLETTNVRLDETYAARHRDVRAGSYALIAVSDTGSGTSEDANLFEPLFSTMNLERLAQVGAFAEDSGGHLTVEGDLRRGTTVKVYLPRLTGALACNPRS